MNRIDKRFDKSIYQTEPYWSIRFNKGHLSISAGACLRESLYKPFHDANWVKTSLLLRWASVYNIKAVDFVLKNIKSGDPNTRQVQYSNGWNMSDHWMDWYITGMESSGEWAGPWGVPNSALHIYWIRCGFSSFSFLSDPLCVEVVQIEQNWDPLRAKLDIFKTGLDSYWCFEFKRQSHWFYSRECWRSGWHECFNQSNTRH